MVKNKQILTWKKGQVFTKQYIVLLNGLRLMMLSFVILVLSLLFFLSHVI